MKYIVVNPDNNEILCEGEYERYSDMEEIEEDVLCILREKGYHVEKKFNFISEVDGYTVCIPIEHILLTSGFICRFEGESGLFLTNMFQFLDEGTFGDKLAVMTPYYLLGKTLPTRHDIVCNGFAGELPVCYFTAETIEKLREEFPYASHITDVFLRFDYRDEFGNEFKYNCMSLPEQIAKDYLDVDSTNVRLCNFGRVEYPCAENNELFRKSNVNNFETKLIVTYKNKTYTDKKFTFNSPKEYLDKIHEAVRKVLDEESKGSNSFESAIKKMSGK